MKHPTEPQPAEQIHLDFERRLGRLEWFVYMILALSGANLMGVRVFDAVYLFPHP